MELNICILYDSYNYLILYDFASFPFIFFPRVENIKDVHVVSCRSTPSSSMSTSAMDSEADFARLAENLALKSDGKVAFISFKRGRFS